MKNKIKIWLLAVTVGIFSASLFSVAQAAIVLTAQGDQRGSYNDPSLPDNPAFGLNPGERIAGNSYQVRTLGDGAASIQRSAAYFSFLIPALNPGQSFGSAVLTITHACAFNTGTCTKAKETSQAATNGSFDSAFTTTIDGIANAEQVTFFDVDPILAASLNGSKLIITQAEYDDLWTVGAGVGGNFGNFIATDSVNGTPTTESVTLTSFALNGIGGRSLTEIGLAGGGVWSIGAALTSGNSIAFGSTERVFRGSDSLADSPAGCTLGVDCLSFQPDSVLTLTAVPVPASVWLFGSGVIGLVGLGRRRSKAA